MSNYNNYPFKLSHEFRNAFPAIYSFPFTVFPLFFHIAAGNFSQAPAESAIRFPIHLFHAKRSFSYDQFFS